MRSPSDKDLHLISSLVTMCIMGLVVLAIMSAGTGAGAEPRKKNGLDDALRIEAALAFKKKDTKTKQPQKRKRQTFKEPEGPKISRDETAKPLDKKEDKPRVKPDEIDPLSVLKKNRQFQDDDTASDTGSVEPDEGAVFGSEWGSGDKNIGDPYVGGLQARMKRTFEAQAPGFLEKGKTVWGCVKLDKEGKVAEGEVPEEGRSDTPALNSAMEETLKKVPAMDQPVPQHLVKLLTEMGVCFRFKTK